MDNQENQQVKSNSVEDSFSPVRKRSYKKFVLSFLIIIVALFIVYPVLKTLYKNYANRSGFDAYFLAEREYLNALKNDKYGGKTPEETYFMYLDALKKGNIELASKYFIGIEGPERAYKWLSRLQRDGWLDRYVNTLPSDWSKMIENRYWLPDSKEFVFTFTQKNDYIYFDKFKQETSTILAGDHEDSIIFQFSQPAQIWKLYF